MFIFFKRWQEGRLSLLPLSFPPLPRFRVSLVATLLIYHPAAFPTHLPPVLPFTPPPAAPACYRIKPFHSTIQLDVTISWRTRMGQTGRGGGDRSQRSATSATTNAFRVAVALCVDADLENERRRSSGADASSSSILMSVASDVDGNARRKRTNGGGGSGSSRSHGVSGGPASPLAVSPMCVSFRGLFEAFGAALEAPLLSRSASFGGGGGGKSGVGKTAAGADAAGAGREAVGLLLYSLLQANPGFLRAAVVRSDADVLLLPLLRILHNCGSAAGGSGGKSTAKLKLAKASEGLQGVGQQQQRQQSPAALYVPAIVVLLFSQDSGFNRQAFRQVLA